MANLVSINDFIGQNNIPNKDLVGENLTGFIVKYEKKFLIELLGNTLYLLLVASPTDVRFVNLIPYLKPAIVDYVYWFYKEDEVLQSVGTGTVTPKNQNSIPANPYPKMVRAWNEMVDYNKETNKFLKDNGAIYPEYPVILPTWFYVNGWYPDFDWSWYCLFGYTQIPEIYRIKNQLGI